MNRRAFLQALGIVPLGAVASAVTAHAAPEPVSVRLYGNAVFDPRIGTCAISHDGVTWYYQADDWDDRAAPNDGGW